MTTPVTDAPGATSPGSPAPPDGPDDGPYRAFAERVLAEGTITDPWLAGVPRLEEAPRIVDAAFAHRLALAAEDLAEAYDELVQLAIDDPSVLDDFFSVTPAQRAMFLASAPRWHGIARADLFVTADGLVASELNADTPTGEPEAVVLGALAAEGRTDGARDPNAGLGRRFVTMVDHVFQRLAGEAPRTVGIVYPTEFTEDLALVRLYRRWLAEAGWGVVLGSPYNLDEDEHGRATLFDEPIGVLLRHYKTDWWGERSSAWSDEAIADVAPLTGPLGVAVRAEIAGKTAVVNPFASILPQNKRSMAFFWEGLHRFGRKSQATIERLVPRSSRLETVHPEHLRAAKDQWVLKSDYGAEGEEVVIGRLTTQETWEASLRLARPGRWIAQQHFEAERDARGRIANYGVYLVAGRAAGLYLRVAEGPHDASSLSAPILVARG